uniref:Ig-like domain-containing protein n=1 Tax=Hucho hucho TaxID=62062 RepID=A0A4W5Q9T1_9TELE
VAWSAAEAVNLHQEQLTVTKSLGKSGVIECSATDFTTGTIHWYQQRDGEALSPLFNASGLKLSPCNIVLLSSSSLDLNEQKDDTFLSRIYLECDSGSGTLDLLRFGSGSKLIILRKPKVSMYLASKPEPNGKTSLLCLARDMFPDLVKISWKMEDNNGRTVEVPKEELEQREEGRTTSMIITYQGKADAKYVCSVKHEAGSEEADTSKGSQRLKYSTIWVVFSFLFVFELLVHMAMC